MLGNSSYIRLQNYPVAGVTCRHSTSNGVLGGASSIGTRNNMDDQKGSFKSEEANTARAPGRQNFFHRLRTKRDTAAHGSGSKCRKAHA